MNNTENLFIEHYRLGNYILSILNKRYNVIDTHYTKVNRYHERFAVKIKELKHWCVNIWVCSSNEDKPKFFAYMSHKDYPKYDNPIDAYYRTDYAICVPYDDDGSPVNDTPTSIVNLCNMIDTVIKHRITAYAQVCSANDNIKYCDTNYFKISICNWYMRHKEKYDKKQQIKYIKKMVDNVLSDYKDTVTVYDMREINDSMVVLNVSIAHDALEDEVREVKQVLSLIQHTKDVDMTITYYEMKKAE